LDIAPIVPLVPLVAGILNSLAFWLNFSLLVLNPIHTPRQHNPSKFLNVGVHKYATSAVKNDNLLFQNPKPQPEPVSRQTYVIGGGDDNDYDYRVKHQQETL
jgi:hypothetical protein